MNIEGLGGNKEFAEAKQPITSEYRAFLNKALALAMTEAMSDKLIKKNTNQSRLDRRNNLIRGTFGTGDKKVCLAQASLVLAGYDLGNFGVKGVDGRLGDLTRKAITEFQQTIGLKPTGNLDPMTMSALDFITKKGLTRSQIELIGKETHQPLRDERKKETIPPLKSDRKKVIEERSVIKTWDDKDKALKYITDIEIPAWKINSKGEKISTRYSFKVNKEIAAEVKQIFNEIYNDPEHYPIQQIGAWRWKEVDFYKDGKVHFPNHPSGTAIDINESWNGMYDTKTGALLAAGTYGYNPEKNPYSMDKDCSVVRIFLKHGWHWGGHWNNPHDYMHFSLLGG